jgi:hypothetical protein
MGRNILNKNVLALCGATDEISGSCKNASSAMFHSWPWGKNETCVDILSDSTCFILYFKKKMFCAESSSLSYFARIYNADECKRIGQGKSLGQLYEVQNWINISSLIQPNSFITTFSGLLSSIWAAWALYNFSSLRVLFINLVNDTKSALKRTWNK